MAFRRTGGGAVDAAGAGAGGGGGGGGGGEGAPGACQLTVQTLVDHPSSKVARHFTKAAKKAVDAALSASSGASSRARAACVGVLRKHRKSYTLEAGACREGEGGN